MYIQRTLIVLLPLITIYCTDDNEQIKSLTVPQLVSPENGITLASTTVTFEWTVVKNAEGYELEIATNANFTSVIESRTGIKTTSIEEEGLAFQTTYFWRVRAYRKQLISDWSATSQLTIAPIPTPLPLLPASNSVLKTLQVSLEWSLVEQADSYTLQVSADEGFGSVLIEETGLSGTSVIIETTTWFEDYFWRVRAENGGQSSSWSEVQSFRTVHPVPEADLIAHYPFNGNADDATGNQYHGTVTGAELAADRFGTGSSAYLFDGVDDFIRIEHHDALNLIGNFTVSAWINSDGCEVVCDPPGYHTIIMKREAHLSPDDWPWGISISYINNALGPVLKTAVGSRRTDGIMEYKWSDQTIILNNWHHIVLKLESNVQSIYIDCVLTSNSELFEEQRPNEKPMVIGSSLRNDGSEFFKGKIDDVRIYSRALNEDEIGGLFYE